MDTATSALFLKAPVANAFGSPGKMPTSGIPMPALSAKPRTVSTIQRSSAEPVPSMICTLALHLAMGLLISSEMMAPPNPMISEKPSNAVRLSPLAVRKRLTPSKLATTPNTSTTARLVITNNRIRFMGSPWDKTTR
ncbi:hypothetical protein D3C87_1801480 [compost metagenome]